MDEETRERLKSTNVANLHDTVVYTYYVKHSCVCNVTLHVVSDLAESLEQRKEREYKLILESELYDLPETTLLVPATTPSKVC